MTKKHFSTRENELRAQLRVGELTSDSLEDAQALVQETHKLEHLSLYAQIKRTLADTDPSREELTDKVAALEAKLAEYEKTEEQTDS
ncbi:hypothetical protein ACKA0G_29080 [Priestia megaterium]|uniref:hypothetical protein n=1 Tax=Priestia megaterium TaxID=1404 RepID=UPI0038B009A4